MTASAWWGTVMRHCMGKLAMPPGTFWSMSLPELDAILAPWRARSSGNPGRAELETLMGRFPDRPASGGGPEEDTCPTSQQ